MNAIQITILSIAMALSTLSAFLTGGWVLKDELFTRKIRFLLVSLFIQALMIAAGLWLGIRISPIAISSGFFISLGILLIMGIKIIFDSIRSKPESKVFDLTEWRSMILVSIAEGMTSLIVSIAIGLVSEVLLLPWLILVFGQLVAIIVGVISGSRLGAGVFKLRAGPVGGLIILAAALKMLIDVIGF